MRRLFRQIKKFFQLIYYYYVRKLNNTDGINYGDRVEEYAKKYNEVLSDINPIFIKKFDEYVKKSYDDLFGTYLDRFGFYRLKLMEIEIDFLEENYVGEFNILNYGFMKNEINKIYNKTYGYPNKPIDGQAELDRLKNKLINYMKSSNKYQHLKHYVFSNFEEEIYELKLQIVNYISIVNDDNVDDIILNIVTGYMSRTFGRNIRLYDAPTTLRFNTDLKTPKKINISILAKIKVYIQSVDYVIKNYKKMSPKSTDPILILNNRIYAKDGFMKFENTIGFRGWLNRTLLLVRYLFDGNFIKNYKNVKSYRKLLSKTNITDGRRNDLTIKMMKSLDLNKRLIKKDS